TSPIFWFPLVGVGGGGLCLSEIGGGHRVRGGGSGRPGHLTVASGIGDGYLRGAHPPPRSGWNRGTSTGFPTSGRSGGSPATPGRTSGSGGIAGGCGWPTPPRPASPPPPAPAVRRRCSSPTSFGGGEASRPPRTRTTCPPSGGGVVPGGGVRTLP